MNDTMRAPTSSPSRPTRLRPGAAAIPLGFALSLCAQSVAALGLGDLTLESGLGQPLRAHVALIAAPDEALPAASCFSLSGEQGADMPRLSRARLSVEKRADGARLTIRSTQPVNEPILMVGIRVQCGLGVERDYTLLPEPIAAAPELPVVATPAGERPARAGRPPAATGQWVTSRGETLQGIAEALYPDSRRMQRRFVGAVARANPGVFEGGDAANLPLAEGTRLAVPSLRALSATGRPEPDRAAAEAAPSPARRKAPAAEGEAAARTDRLRIGAAPPEATRSATAGNRDLQAREQRLMAAMEDMVSMELSIADRMVKLEKTVVGLRAAIEEADRQIQVASAPAGQPAAAAVPAAAPPAAAPRSVPDAVPAPVSGEGPTAWLIAAALGLAAVGGLLAWRRRAAARPAATEPEVEPEAAPPSRFTTVDIPVAEPLPPPAAKPAAPPRPVPVPREDDHAVEVAEHASAAELAEIMLAFGQSDDALRSLSDYVAANPQQLVGPWMKMLEVYRGADMRKEFDALAGRLHKMFNVAVPVWAGAAGKVFPQRLEEYPHVIARVQEVWGRREALDYLIHLVTDNRNGTRFGFSVAVIQEILLLISVMAERQSAAGSPA